MDTLDGCFMNVAYGWAFFNPVRKVYYNLAITGLSVAICFFIGTIEVLGLLPTELHLHGGFWDVMAGLQHQHRRLRDRRPVRPHLGRGPRRLALRPGRGEVERHPQAGPTASRTLSRPASAVAFPDAAYRPAPSTAAGSTTLIGPRSTTVARSS